jgi:hypothetical protein
MFFKKDTDVFLTMKINQKNEALKDLFIRPVLPI